MIKRKLVLQCDMAISPCIPERKKKFNSIERVVVENPENEMLGQISANQKQRESKKREETDIL